MYKEPGEREGERKKSENKMSIKLIFYWSLSVYEAFKSHLIPNDFLHNNRIVVGFFLFHC